MGKKKKAKGMRVGSVKPAASHRSYGGGY